MSRRSLITKVRRALHNFSISGRAKSRFSWDSLSSLPQSKGSPGRDWGNPNKLCKWRTGHRADIKYAGWTQDCASQPASQPAESRTKNKFLAPQQQLKLTDGPRTPDSGGLGIGFDSGDWDWELEQLPHSAAAFGLLFRPTHIPIPALTKETPPFRSGSFSFINVLVFPEPKMQHEMQAAGVVIDEILQIASTRLHIDGFSMTNAA